MLFRLNAMKRTTMDFFGHRSGAVSSALLVGLVLASVPAGNVQADIIIDVQNASITAGGTGFVDVLITSTALPGTPDNVDYASYNFGFAAIGIPGSTLEFTLPPDLTEDTTIGSYLFSADSAGMDYDAIHSTVADYIGFDGTALFSGVDIDNTTSNLLVRLDLNHILGPGQSAAMANGEQFRMTLLNTADTFFEDFNLNPVNIDASSFDAFGVGGGVITVSGATAAVPEPSSFLLLAIGAVGFGVHVRRRRPLKSELPV